MNLTTITITSDQAGKDVLFTGRPHEVRHKSRCLKRLKIDLYYFDADGRPVTPLQIRKAANAAFMAVACSDMPNRRDYDQKRVQYADLV